MPNFDFVDVFTKHVLTLEDEWSPPLWFIKFVAVSMLSAAASNRIWTISGSRRKLYANQYIMLVAPSGVGKSSVCNEAHELFDATSHKGRMMYLHNVQTTWSGLVTKVMRTDLIPKAARQKNQAWELDEKHPPQAQVYLVSDEISSCFGYQEHGDLVINGLTSAYEPDSPFGKLTNIDDYVPVKNHSINWLATTTPEDLNKWISYRAYRSGFMARVATVYETTKELPKDGYTSPEIKAALTSRLQQILAAKPGHAIRKEEGVKELEEAFAKRCKGEWWENEPQLRALLERLPIVAQKIALALALGKANVKLIDGTGEEVLDLATTCITSEITNESFQYAEAALKGAKELYPMIGKSALQVQTDELWIRLCVYARARSDSFILPQELHKEAAAMNLTNLQVNGILEQWSSMGRIEYKASPVAKYIIKEKA